MQKFFINQTDNSKIVIGGVRLLSGFDCENISVKVKAGAVNISGSGLKIERFDENEIEVIGKIENVETVASGRRNA